MMLIRLTKILNQGRERCVLLPEKKVGRQPLGAAQGNAGEALVCLLGQQNNGWKEPRLMVQLKAGKTGHFTVPLEVFLFLLLCYCVHVSAVHIHANHCRFRARC